MKIFPTLHTKRLRLTELSYKDIPQIMAYANNEKVAAMTLNIPHPYQEKDALFWLHSAQQGFAQQTQYTFALHLAQTEGFIGGIGLKINPRFDRATLGYWLAEPYWNQGYTTEAVGALLAFGFQELGLHKIYATHLVENPASGKVMLKNGMIQEGELKDHDKKEGIYRSSIQYRLTKPEFDQLLPQP